MGNYCFFKLKMDDEGVIMPLYWACQEVQAKLQDPANSNIRKDIISRSITYHLDKFSKTKERIDFAEHLTWFNTSSSISR